MTPTGVYERNPKHNYKFGLKASKNPNWKGGKFKIGSGYVLSRCPGHPFPCKENYVYEHRVVMEKQLGRYLKPKEIVHHINGKRDDNRIENLMLFSCSAEHNRWHKNTQAKHLETLIIGSRSGIGKSMKSIIPNSKIISSNTKTWKNFLPCFRKAKNIIITSGIGWFKGIESIDDKKIKELIKFNVTDPIRKIRDLLQSKNNIKKIVFIGSNCADKGFPNNNIYAATKGAIRAFALNLGEELSSRGICVSIIHPGTINSPRFWENANADNRDKVIPIEPIEIASIVKTILSLNSCATEWTVLPRKKVSVESNKI